MSAIALTVSSCATLFSANDQPYSGLYSYEGFENEPGRVLLIDPEVFAAEEETRREKAEESRLVREAAISRALASRDIVVGMTPDEVSRTWGEPHDVEYAGQDGSPHQRWVYSEGWSSRYGMAPKRVLYFENGRVAGWETR